jgi:RHS repeat-associated protein
MLIILPHLLQMERGGTLILHTISAIDNSTTPTISNNYIANPIYSRGTSSIPNYPIIQIQKPINVVSSVGLPDGIGGTNTTNYSYTDAQVHIQGGGFLGFGSITSNNSVSNTQVVNKFSTLSNVVTTGVTILEKVPTEMTTTYTQGANTFINKSTYNYSIFPLNSNNLRHFTPLVSQTDIDYTGSTTTSNYTYDNNTTNPTNDNVTEVDINVQGVETKSIINTYTTFQDFTYIPSRILTSTTKVSRPTQPDYQRETDYTYTNEGSIASIITDPTLAKKVTIAYTYFPTGNIQKQATSSSDPNTVPVNLEYTYEPKYRFKASFSNPLQQVSEYIYDSKWGAPLSQTGVDNLTTTYAYDAFGRNIRVNTPDGLTSTTSYDWATAGDKNGWNTDPIDVSQNALTKITSTKDGSPSNIVFYDLFGRQVKSITDGFNNPINMVTTYDALGNLLKQTNAFEGGGNPTHKAITTTYTYDNLSRVNNILQKDVATGNTQITSDYTYLYNSGISTIQANINTASSNPKTITKKYDATGLLIQSGDNGPVFLSYTYGGHHQPVKIDLGATSTIIDYDEYARQKSLTEANSGITAYIYNAYGQLVNKNDNSLVNLYTYAYDGLGRITTITSQGENGGTYNYQYVSSGNGINQLQKVAGPNNFDCIYSYDALNRPTQLQEDIGGLNPFITKTEYDQYNNVNKVTYPGGFAITKTFDSHGYLKKIRDNNGNNIWQTNAIDIFGNFYNYTLGNGITVQKTFSDFGYPTKFYAQGIQDYDFSFDPLTGNLGKRTDNTHNNFENFGYDNQDRLLTVSGSTSLNMIYATSGNGNISSKSDVGNYTYDPNKINAVTEVTNPSGIISSNTQTIDYNAFNKPQIIKELDVTNNFAPINELDYTYGPDQERRVANLFDATGKKISTTYYHHNYEKIVAANGTSFTETSYIGGGDGVCAMYVNDQNGNGNLYFVFRDHLGSILKVTDANGTSISEQSFDAWGKPRDPANWNSSPAQSKPSWLIRGFTGHEHLPQFSLINMNARLYDPINARVASVDNDVEDPGNTQNYNRYSYCLNNPLKYTDPTGNDATNDFLIEYIGNLFNGNEMADQNAVDDIASASSVTSYTPPAGSKNPDGFMPQYVIQPNPAGPDEPDEDPLGVLQMNYNIKLSSPMPIQNIQGGITTSPVSSIQTFAGNTASPISQLSSVPGDASGWMSNFRSAVGLTTIWATGMPVKQITFNNNTIANAFRNSSGIAQARNEYYQLGQTTGSYNFGLSGLISAGIDPMEQFVGSFDYTVTPMGNNLQYTMKNTTSFSSAAYHLWPASMNWHNGPMSNTSQTYIFSEPILKLGK